MSDRRATVRTRPSIAAFLSALWHYDVTEDIVDRLMVAAVDPLPYFKPAGEIICDEQALRVWAEKRGPQQLPLVREKLDSRLSRHQRGKRRSR